MQQIKMFHGLESDMLAVEKDVNRWLKENAAVKVVNIFGNIAPQTERAEGQPGKVLGAERTTSRGFFASDILIIVVYETA